MTFPRKLHFYTVKLPFILMIIPLGFILEFILSLPFIVLCELDRWFQRWTDPDPPPRSDASRGFD